MLGCDHKHNTRIKRGSRMKIWNGEIPKFMISIKLDGIQAMLSKMGMSASGLGKGGKVNYGAMEAELNKKMRLAKMKERMHAKSEMNKAMKEAQQNQQQQVSSKPAMTEDELIALFSKSEKPIKTPRNANPNNVTNEDQQPSKPKNKKKKGKK
jgi:hypothetical protein